MTDSNDRGVTRRKALGLAGSAALAALPGCTSENARIPSKAHAETHTMTTPNTRMPVVYLPHGGGPWPFVELNFGDPAELRALATYLRSLKTLPAERPRAVLMVSAHWEESVPTVMTSERPPMLYDYYGFPPESYQITWPAPGSPALAARVRALLHAQGIASGDSPTRGFDHGAFVPMKLTWPDADVATVQLSLKAGLNAEEHLRIGRALAPLRDEGVFILGSGMSYHNLNALRGGRVEAAAASGLFDAWLTETVTREPAERDRRLAEWQSAPAARRAHPREEHLIPLMVIAGAAGADHGRAGWQGPVMGALVSAYHFG